MFELPDAVRQLNLSKWTTGCLEACRILGLSGDQRQTLPDLLSLLASNCGMSVSSLFDDVLRFVVNGLELDESKREWYDYQPDTDELMFSIDDL